MTIRVERIGPYTYLVIGADRFLLTVDDQIRIAQELVWSPPK